MDEFMRVCAAFLLICTQHAIYLLEDAGLLRAFIHSGELGELLRRERFYHNKLSQWRKEFEAKGISGLSKSAPGPRCCHQRYKNDPLTPGNIPLVSEIIRPLYS